MASRFEGVKYSRGSWRVRGGLGGVLGVFNIGKVTPRPNGEKYIFNATQLQPKRRFMNLKQCQPIAIALLESIDPISPNCTMDETDGGPQGWLREA